MSNRYFAWKTIFYQKIHKHLEVIRHSFARFLKFVLYYGFWYRFIYFLDLSTTKGSSFSTSKFAIPTLKVYYLKKRFPRKNRHFKQKTSGRWNFSQIFHLSDHHPVGSDIPIRIGQTFHDYDPKFRFHLQIFRIRMVALNPFRDLSRLYRFHSLYFI